MTKLVYPDACPDCGHTLHRSRKRGFIEKLIARVFKIAAFRCSRCGTRFYSPPAVMVHAPKTEINSRHHHDLVVDDLPVPEVVIKPPEGGVVQKIVVAMDKPAASANKTLPRSREAWTQQALTITPSVGARLWVRSSDTWKDDSA